jgi:hypothetical protein
VTTEARIMSSRLRTIDDFLSLLQGVKRVGDRQYIARCPAHEDNSPSLSIKQADGKVLLHCFAGCQWDEILKRLGLEAGDLIFDCNKASRGCSNSGEPCQHVNGKPKHVQNGVDTHVDRGINLVDLALTKRLPVEFLKSLGISDFKYLGQSAVRIPYYSEHGAEVSIRFRLALTGDSRFRWRKGDRALPYGLNRLEQARQKGWVLVVEGESDCWTCWYHDIPAIGAPGKAIWPVNWGGYLRGLEVYVWQEPAAEDFVLRVLESAPGLRYIAAPHGIKDVSEAHIQGVQLSAWLEELKSKARSGQELKAQHTDVQLRQLYDKARACIEANDPLKLVRDAIRDLGYGGDLKPALITYLAATSRLLAMRDGAMPVHLLLTGASCSGKSYTVSLVRKLLPQEAYHIIDAGSPRTIIYNDAALRHRLLVFGEADSLPAGEDNPAASAIRNLLQDHCLHYEVTVRDARSGDYAVRKVQKAGPTVLITTSTRPLGEQLMTRLFSLEISDSKEQISAALQTQAALETDGTRQPDPALVALQSYLQLRAPVDVVVPFAAELARAMAEMIAAPRILRDFQRLLSLVKSVAVIRHHRRRIDSHGRIVATLADYETVRELVNEMYIDSSTGATADIRKLVDAVRTLEAKRDGDERITNSKLAKYLGMGVKQATRLAQRAIRHGWLVNREQRKWHPADYAAGEPMPEANGLPLLCVDAEAVNDSSFTKGEVDTLTPMTNDGTTHPRLCYTCSSTHWWRRRDGGWVCGVCHPNPEGIQDSKALGSLDHGDLASKDLSNDFGDGGKNLRESFEFEPTIAPKESKVSPRDVAQSNFTPLGMSREQAIAIWAREGRPVIHLGPGENCFDLERLLSHRDINGRHLEAVRQWLARKERPPDNRA